MIKKKSINIGLTKYKSMHFLNKKKKNPQWYTMKQMAFNSTYTMLDLLVAHFAW